MADCIYNLPKIYRSKIKLVQKWFKFTGKMQIAHILSLEKPRVGHVYKRSPHLPKNVMANIRIQQLCVRHIVQKMCFFASKNHAKMHAMLQCKEIKNRALMDIPPTIRKIRLEERKN